MNRLDQEVDAFEAGIDALESSDEFEWLGEAEQEWTGESDGEAVFDEVEEMELAADLLGIQTEEELEQFLGKLVSRAAGAVKTFANSTAGQAVGSVLKNVARRALPIAGAALGNMVLPGIGGQIGSRLASAGGRMFGLELEGMSAQDQEFEVARRFVRLGGEAVRQASQMGPQGSPVTAAKDAVLAAARIHAPGLAGGIQTGTAGCACGCKKSGASTAVRRTPAPAGGYGGATAGRSRAPRGYGRASTGYGAGAAGGYGGSAGGGYAAAAPRRRSPSRGYGGGSASGYGGASTGG
ncbi:MAG TPA: hypothetical protein VGX50_17215, partial [Longimicrobium sp.]|nr:hypothetical protein [Longimicrobium sp.]